MNNEYRFKKKHRVKYRNFSLLKQNQWFKFNDQLYGRVDSYSGLARRIYDGKITTIDMDAIVEVID